MRKGKELNKSIGSKSLHHFIQRLLVPSVRQQVAKPQVLMRSQRNCSKQEERRYWTECTECVAIWETGEWPEEWTFSTFIPLPKKGDLKQCAKLQNNCSCLPRKQDPSLDHTGEDPSKDRNGNYRRTGGILTRKGDKRSNHKSQNTNAQGMRAPTTTLYVLCGLQEGV